MESGREIHKNMPFSARRIMPANILALGVSWRMEQKKGLHGERVWNWIRGEEDGFGDQGGREDFQLLNSNSIHSLAWHFVGYLVFELEKAAAVS